MEDNIAVNDNVDTAPEAEALPMVFETKGIPFWYSMLSPIAVLLMAAVVGYLCVYMIGNPNIVSRIFGVLTIVLFLAYIGYYYALFFISRKDITKQATLTGGYIEHITPRGSVRFVLDDIVFTMSYSSATNLCILLATEHEHMVLVCSCSYLFSKSGKQVIKPFYAMNKFFMDMNGKHINYVKNKKYRKQNPFTVPNFLLEIDFHSKRADKFVSEKRAKFRFK